MIIAISQRSMKMKIGANRDALEITYPGYYRKFGVILIPIPNSAGSVEEYFGEMSIKGIILSSGNDVNPALYGEKAKNEDFSEERDKTERELIDITIKRKLPLLGICRGMQFINVYFGGKLVRNIKEKTKTNHVAVTHRVKITDEKAIGFFNKKEYTVNSYHNQGIDENALSPKLKAFAVTEDGSIEGIYHPKYRIAGIMWHPERQGSDNRMDEKLVRAFIDRKLFWGK